MCGLLVKCSTPLARISKKNFVQQCFEYVFFSSSGGAAFHLPILLNIFKSIEILFYRLISWRNGVCFFVRVVGGTPVGGFPVFTPNLYIPLTKSVHLPPPRQLYISYPGGGRKLCRNLVGVWLSSGLGRKQTSDGSGGEGVEGGFAGMMSRLLRTFSISTVYPW